jgi:hypothetical protein
VGSGEVISPPFLQACRTIISGLVLPAPIKRTADHVLYPVVLQVGCYASVEQLYYEFDKIESYFSMIR